MFLNVAMQVTKARASDHPQSRIRDSDDGQWWAVLRMRWTIIPLQNPDIFLCILVSFFKGELSGKNELLGCLKPEKDGKMVFTLSNPTGPLNSGRETRAPSRKAPALIPHLDLLSSSSPRPFAGNAWQYMPGNKFWRFNKTISVGLCLRFSSEFNSLQQKHGRKSFGGERTPRWKR